MFTVCPKCALTLVVTAADLRIAQGYVRCGRCSSVFNALARLTDDRQAAESLSEAQQPAAARTESSPHAFELVEAPEPTGPTEPQVPSEESVHPAAHGKDSRPGEAQHQEARREEAAREQAPPEWHAEALDQAADFSAKPEAGVAEERDAPPAPSPIPTDPFVALPAAAAEEEAIPESALEFNPTTTDAAAVFIEPPPDPAWTAATGTFKAMIAGAQLTVPPDSSSEDVESVGRPPEANTGAERTAGTSSDDPSTDDLSTDDLSTADITMDDTSSLAAASPAVSLLGANSPDPSSSESFAEPGSPEAAQPQPGAFAATPEPGASAISDSRSAPPARSAPTRVREAAYAVRSRSGSRHTVSQGRPPVAAAARRPAPAERQDDRDLSAAVDLIDESAFDEERDEEGRARGRMWGVATAIASFVLLLQIVHHYRDDLAVHVGLNRPLTALYAALGMPLVPRWDLRAYDVRQLGAVADPASAGLITVRASIKNSAQQAQPLPLLRVTLQDRFGNRIAARDVAPRSYLPHATPDSSFLGAGQRIDAEMGFVDPGANAVGFEIDACLPQRGGIACANDSAMR
jgi:predicted Zn finger-like uncharacterized protein